MQQSKVFVKNEKSNKAGKPAGQPKPQHDGKQWQRNDNKRQQFE